jgi:glycosyltransferase involved in cell wall biosynthesis
MNTYPNISVIIPSNHGHDDLLKIVCAIVFQTIKPAEIIIVDSSNECGTSPSDITSLCATHNVKLNYIHYENALPGQARNIGLDNANSNADMIAFIDVQTIPKPCWLEASLELIIINHVAGVYGSTTFSAKNSFESLVRDAFYGVSPRRTLPGSIFRREVFVKAGQLIDWVRAGEDTEWMLRLELMNIPVIFSPTNQIDYIGLIGIDIKKILKKWYRNYTASQDLPHFFPQKLFLWLFLYPTLIFVAFNWNYLVANWRMDSPLYIGHITKIAVFLPILVYIITRGILLPMRRGVGFSRLFPIRFIAIAFISFMADAVKAWTFSVPSQRKDSRIDQYK